MSGYSFHQAGADVVGTEEFTIPQSWTKGNTEVNVVAPSRFHVRAQAGACAPPLPPTTARVVDIGSGSEADFAKVGDISGAIILVHSNVLKSWEDLFEEYFTAAPILDSAVKGRALAVAFTSTREHDLLYQHINAITGKIDVIPRVLLAREDILRIQRLLAHGYIRKFDFIQLKKNEAITAKLILELAICQIALVPGTRDRKLKGPLLRPI